MSRRFPPFRAPVVRPLRRAALRDPSGSAAPRDCAPQAPERLRAEICRPSELGTAEIDRWHRFQAEQGLTNPFLSPEFATAVGAVDPATRIAVLSDGAEQIGFLPFMQGRWRQATALAYADCQALVGSAAIAWNLPDAVRVSGITHWEFDHLVGAQSGGVRAARRVPAAVIDTGRGFDWYVQAVRPRSKKSFKMIEVRRRQLGERFPGFAFFYDAGDANALALLLDWKSRQYRRTGRRDPFARPAMRELVERIAASNAPALSGCISVLCDGWRPISVDFGLVSDDVYAGWLTAYEPGLARYSPGSVRLHCLIEALCASGIGTFELGKGDEAYKGKMATGWIDIAEGWIGHQSTASYVRRAYVVPRDAARQVILTNPRVRRAVRAGLRRAGHLRARHLRRA